MNAQGTMESERLHRKMLRYCMTGAAALLGSGVILGIVQANVQEWAKANSQDQYLVKYTRPVVDRLIELTQSSVFFAIAWAVIGAAAILWIDYAIRRRTKKMAVALYIVAFFLAGLATWILFRPVITAEAQQSSRSKISDAEKDKTIASLRQELAASKRLTEFYEARDRSKSSADALLSLAQKNGPESGIARGVNAIANLYSPEREFTKKTVRELRAFYEGRTRLQADAFMADEKGKLIEVDGTVVNVDSGMAFLNVGQDLHNGMTDSVECRFGSEWNAKLSTYRQNEHMKIRGVVGPSQNGAQIYLQDCEVIG